MDPSQVTIFEGKLKQRKHVKTVVAKRAYAEAGRKYGRANHEGEPWLVAMAAIAINENLRGEPIEKIRFGVGRTYSATDSFLYRVKVNRGNETLRFLQNGGERLIATRHKCHWNGNEDAWLTTWKKEKEARLARSKPAPCRLPNIHELATCMGRTVEALEQRFFFLCFQFDTSNPGFGLLKPTAEKVALLLRFIHQ